MARKRPVNWWIFFVIVLVLAAAMVHGLVLGDPGYWVPALIAVGCGSYVLWKGRRHVMG
ncbi:hypothetical protein GCM10009710_13530 [Aeromicrobium alkaliterrae]|uniref:DUF4175 domain-containing protein n=1 Tax=Aeromicrobium alkaliterrae TaxID=302168 RepID=A0ABN2JP23_9ACTN